MEVAGARATAPFYARRGKRIFDATVGSFLLVVSAPVQLVVAGLVRNKLGSPVLFRQERPGLDERTFEVVKFRTMTDARGADGALLPNEDRLTPFGRLLRSTSLDELPELINVVRGEMSLVGPRPLLASYLSRYTPRQARRHLVRPGLTGLAQVSGRNALSWPEKLELDAIYVDTLSFTGDLRILLATVRSVLTRRGIHSEGHAVAAPFDPGGESLDEVSLPTTGAVSEVADPQWR